ncbi:hypothetical protein F7725_013505 [Dissostichus mawsoni]|uniref:Uncharacterized protein n=1 Tax=Dissostichus mawsoni TaxID=36200 RepID=A0A7J5Y402_DISMA|nr:hypothetical protein F7725_013505 [Dissostichus mawsoni]
MWIQKLDLHPGLMTHCKSHLERENASTPNRQPEQRDDAYETLLSRETERAEIQIRLAKEQIQLCRLQQTETSLRIQLLKARLDDPAAFKLMIFCCYPRILA